MTTIDVVITLPDNYPIFDIENIDDNYKVVGYYANVNNL